MRRIGGALFLSLLCVMVLAGTAGAHTALVVSDPPAGSVVDQPPQSVHLNFTEPPEPSLSRVTLSDGKGRAIQAGAPVPVAGDPHEVVFALRGLSREVYAVSWRAVSRVDGHVTSGTFDFGVGVPPGLGTDAEVSPAGVSPAEALARWLYLLGMAAALGAMVAAGAGFGSVRGGVPAWAGIAAAAAGLALLASAQISAASTSIGDVVDTRIGRALLGRAGALACAALLLVFARRGRIYRWLAAAAIAAGVAIHVAFGHAGGESSAGALEVLAQWSHFAAAGVWGGGLAALLAGLRSTPAEEKAKLVRRFSTVAGVALAIVIVTGVVRSLDELDSWADLAATAYGRLIALKTVIFGGILALGAVNRYRNLPRLPQAEPNLRKTSRAELTLAVAALGAAALLGATSPPANAPIRGGITVNGTDFATTVKVRLTALLDRPGANKFLAEVTDFDTGKPVDGRVGLRFDSLDDPSATSTLLRMEKLANSSFSAVGNNLAFDGRWQVTADVTRKEGAASVPMRLDVEYEVPRPVVLRVPGEPAIYTVPLSNGGSAIFRVEDKAPGRLGLTMGFYDFFGSETPIAYPVMTMSTGGAEPEEQVISRTGPGGFESTIAPEEGGVTVALAGRTSAGSRLRAVVLLDALRTS